MMLVGLELVAPGSQVKYSTTEPLCSLHVICESSYKGTILKEINSIITCESFARKTSQNLLSTVATIGGLNLTLKAPITTAADHKF